MTTLGPKQGNAPTEQGVASRDIVLASPSPRAPGLDAVTAADAKRSLLVANSWTLIHHEPQVHYIARRPMKNERDQMVNVVKRFGEGIGIWMDCSESVSMLYFTSGGRDPNGLGFNSWGNSHTMWQHLTHRYTDPNNAHPGALGVFGDQGSEHVAMVIEHDARNPLLFSHGSEAGPLAIRLEDEKKYHRGQAFTFLDVSSLL